MKKLILKVLLLSTILSFSQNTPKQDFDNQIKPLTVKIETLKAENTILKKDISNQSLILNSAISKIKNLEHRVNKNDSLISNTNVELGTKIATSETNSNQKITQVNNSLSKNSLLGIIAVLLGIVLTGLLYWLLNNRQKTNMTSMIEQLKNTKASIEESLIKEFSKQTDLMENQVELIKNQKASDKANLNSEPDHSLALKLASEINLIERNLNLMDSKTKGLKQLNASIGKLKDNLAANGYEMPIMLGKPFHQGMKVIITSSIPDESLEKDIEIISKVLIPQVNYNDVMIQTAQIEVSVGY